MSNTKILPGSVGVAENSAQASALMSAFPGMLLIGLTAEVDYWAEKEGRAYIDIETLHQERQRRHIGRQTINKTEEIIRILDRQLGAFIAEQTFGETISFHAYFHYINSLLDSIVLRVDQLVAALESLQPGRVFCLRCPAYSFSGLSTGERSASGLASNLLPLVAESLRLPIVWLDGALSHEQHSSSDLGDQPKDRTSIKCALSRVLRLFKSLGYRGVSAPPTQPTRSGLRENNAPILIVSLSSDLGNEVQSEWIEQCGSLVAFEEAFPPNTDPEFASWSRDIANRLFDSAINDQEFRKLFQWNNVDFFSLAFPWLKILFLQAFPELLRRAESIWRILMIEKKYPNAALLAGGWVTDHYVAARAANFADMPTISAHYSGFIGYAAVPKHERYDFAWCDYFLCGGRAAEVVLQTPTYQAAWRESTKRAKPIATGLPWVWQRVQTTRGKLPLHTDKTRVMVVLNALSGDCRDLGYVTAPEISYWRFTRRLVARLLRVESLQVIVKLPIRSRYPQLISPLEYWLEEKHPGRVEILRDTDFRECLDAADVFALEGPSTPLLHAVATDKPLLLYINDADYLLNKNALIALSHRSSAFGTSEHEFFESLDLFLTKQTFPNVCMPNDEFLINYASGPLNENPAKKAAAFIRSLLPGNFDDSVGDIPFGRCSSR